ncbi:unnamed protein product, partial [Oppiella nova]
MTTTSLCANMSAPVAIIDKRYELDTKDIVHFLLIRFDTTFLLWVGQSPDTARLADLSLAIGVHSTPLLAAHSAHQLSSSLASKLSVKYNKCRPVYVAFNHPMADRTDSRFMIAVNRQIIE